MIDNIYGAIGNKTIVIGKMYYEKTKSRDVNFKYFYVGWEFTLEDIVTREVNSRNIGVNDITAFRQKFVAAGASSVVYFPQTDTYIFNNDTDNVVTYVVGEDPKVTEQRIMDKVNSYLAKKRVIADRVNELVNSSDLDDPLYELYDVEMPYDSVRPSGR